MGRMDGEEVRIIYIVKERRSEMSGEVQMTGLE
jgi:hypothetical protein